MIGTTTNARLKASLEELAGLGSPVDLSVAMTEENEKVEINQVGWIYESRAFELRNRRIACVAYVVVTNQTSRTIYVVDVKMRTLWDDSPLEWLTPVELKFRDDKMRACSRPVYQFPGEDGVPLECDEVINHCLLGRRMLPSKRPLEGYLLAMGGYMPAELRHGQPLEMHLAIIGADHAEYSTTIQLWTDRLLPRTKTVKTRIAIFAKPGDADAMRPGDVIPSAPVPVGQPPALNGV